MGRKQAQRLGRRLQLLLKSRHLGSRAHQRGRGAGARCRRRRKRGRLGRTGALQGAGCRAQRPAVRQRRLECLLRPKLLHPRLPDQAHRVLQLPLSRLQLRLGSLQLLLLLLILLLQGLHICGRVSALLPQVGSHRSRL